MHTTENFQLILKDWIDWKKVLQRYRSIQLEYNFTIVSVIPKSQAPETSSDLEKELEEDKRLRVNALLAGQLLWKIMPDHCQ